MLHVAWEPIDQNDPANLSGYQIVNQEFVSTDCTPYLSCPKFRGCYGELFVINFILFVLSRFKASLVP
jgi:hypothetical protein